MSTIRTNLLEKGCLFVRSAEEMPPWALFYAYRILVFQLHFREEDPALSDVIAVLKLALERLDVRWNIAGEFSYSPLLRHESGRVASRLMGSRRLSAAS